MRGQMCQKDKERERGTRKTKLESGLLAGNIFLMDSGLECHATKKNKLSVDCATKKERELH